MEDKTIVFTSGVDIETEIYQHCPNLVIYVADGRWHWRFRKGTSEVSTNGFNTCVEALADFAGTLVSLIGDDCMSQKPDVVYQPKLL